MEGLVLPPYRKGIQKLNSPSDQMHYLESYNASEGFFEFKDQKI